MNAKSFPIQAAELVASRLPNFTPRIGMVLGSGLGSLANHIQNATTFSYEELPGFPISTVAGHEGRLVVGWIHGVPVACLQGRAHIYEGVSYHAVRTLIRTLKLLGCEILLATNASGSLRADVGPGNIMMITDHINFQPGNPLVGHNDEEFGPRFISMEDAYDLTIRDRMAATANQLGINLAQGVYFSILGPSFETPAEIRAFRTLGADAIGMSTVPEVIVARHCGLRVSVLAAITNFAAGMSPEKLSHEGTLRFANLAAHDLSRLILGFIESFKNEPC